MDAFGTFPGVDPIDPGLVLVPLRDGNEEIGQRDCARRP